MSKLRIWIIIGLALLSVALIQAQTSDLCPVLVDSVLESAANTCSDLDNNQACRASDPVSITMNDISRDLADEKLDLSQLDLISTSNADIDASTGGIAILKAGLNLSDGSVQMILFGDATITNLVEPIELPLATLTATNIAGFPINLREGAGTDFAVSGTVEKDDAILVDGRNAASDWFRVQSDEGISWVYTGLVKLDGDPSTLTLLDSPYTAPLQAFTLSAPIDDSPCGIASSGLLLQYKGEIAAQLSINGLDLKFSDATLLVQATAGETLAIQVIAGEVTAKVQSTERSAKVGQVVTVAIDENLMAIDSGDIGNDYNFADIAGAPTALLSENTLECVLGVAYGDEAVSVYTGPSEEYSLIQTIDSKGHYPVLGYNEAEAGRWLKIDTGRAESWVSQSSVRTAGICSQIELSDAPELVNITQSNEENISYVPLTQSIWQAESGLDVLTGDCSNSSPLAVCSHLAAVIPQEDGSIQWRGQEPIPFPMQSTGLNSFYFTGRNFQNNGNLTLNLTFISSRQWNLSYSTIFDDAPDCTHTFYYSAVPRA